MVEVNAIIFVCFGYISIKSMLKINRERGKRRKIRVKLALWA